MRPQKVLVYLCFLIVALCLLGIFGYRLKAKMERKVLTEHTAAFKAWSDMYSGMASMARYVNGCTSYWQVCERFDSSNAIVMFFDLPGTNMVCCPACLQAPEGRFRVMMNLPAGVSASRTPFMWIEEPMQGKMGVVFWDGHTATIPAFMTLDQYNGRDGSCVSMSKDEFDLVLEAIMKEVAAAGHSLEFAWAIARDASHAIDRASIDPGEFARSRGKPFGVIGPSATTEN